MRVTLDKAALARQMKVFERIIPRKGGGFPFQHVIFFECDVEGTVTLWATHREAYLTRLEAQGTYEDGAAPIPAIELIKALAAAPGETVTLTVEMGDTGCTLTSGTARWQIEGIAGVASIDWETSHGEAVGSVSRKALLDAFEKVRYAASKTEARPSFQQVHVGEGRAVAADGRRIAQIALEAESGALTFDLPERSVDTLSEALVASGADTLEVAPEAVGVLSFRFGPSEYRTAGLSYPFPDIDNLGLNEAREQPGKFTASVSELVTAVKVASVAVDEGGYVTLRFTEGVLEVYGYGTRTAGQMSLRIESNDDLNAWAKRSSATINVVADDLLEALGRVRSDRVSFSVGVGMTPGWVYIEDDGVEAALRPVVR